METNFEARREEDIIRNLGLNDVFVVKRNMPNIC
jgi:hypothetical protein